MAECKIENCTKEAKKRGMCYMHYQRWNRHGDVNYEGKPRKICEVEVCQRYGSYKGYCYKHYRRLAKTGSPFETIHQTHGMTDTKEYMIWCAMKSRCFNPRHPDYTTYGAKGITVAKEWRKHFLNFYRDMGAKPEGYSLDRIDPYGPYSKENCRWIPNWQQQRNKTNTKLNPSDITEMFKMRENGAQINEIAVKFAVSTQMVSRVLRGEAWLNKDTA